MDAPCYDIFEVRDNKIRDRLLPAGTIISVAATALAVVAVLTIVD
jgi:hypothetical protein